MWTVSRLAAAILLVAALGTAAQPADRRQVNRNQLIALLEQTDGAEGRVQAFLSTLPRDEARDAQADVLWWARENNVLTRLEYARHMLALNQEFYPGAEHALDYWRYIIMLAAKLERGEIAQEEYEYLAERKLASAKRESAAEDTRRATGVAQPSPAIDGVGASLIGIGAALRARAPTARTTCSRDLNGNMSCATR